jgi:hypothetical protein
MPGSRFSYDDYIPSCSGFISRHHSSDIPSRRTFDISLWIWRYCRGVGLSRISLDISGGAVLYCTTYTVTNTCLEVPNVSGVGLLMLKHDGLCMMAGEDGGAWWQIMQTDAWWPVHDSRHTTANAVRCKMTYAWWLLPDGWSMMADAWRLVHVCWCMIVDAWKRN